MNRERGQVFPLVLFVLAIGVLVTVPFLSQASSSLIGSRVYGQVVTEQYSCDAGVEHAIWRLKYESGFADSLTAENPMANYSINVNGMTENITVTRTGGESPPESPPPGGPQAWRIEVAKSVEPDSAPLGQPTTFTYTIYIENVGTSTVHMEEISDLLPEGFTYKAGSSQGVSTADPTIEIEDGQQKLFWTLPLPHPSVGGGETVTQVFQATATLEEEDIYWNTAWVTLTPDSIGTVGTGSSAPVGGGSSPYGYDITSSGGETSATASVSITDTGVSIQQWRVE